MEEQADPVSGYQGPGCSHQEEGPGEAKGFRKQGIDHQDDQGPGKDPLEYAGGFYGCVVGS